MTMRVRDLIRLLESNGWRFASVMIVGMKRYAVILEKGETNWGAYSPDVPGCIAIGDTPE